jgi:hypothetical protein
MSHLAPWLPALGKTQPHRRSRVLQSAADLRTIDVAQACIPPRAEAEENAPPGAGERYASAVFVTVFDVLFSPAGANIAVSLPAGKFKRAAWRRD